MFMTPAGALGMWFRGILSIALLVGAGWLISQWYHDLPRYAATTPVTEASQRESNRLADGDLGPRIADSDQAITLNGRELGFIERIGYWRPGADWPTAALGLGALLLIWSLAGRLVDPRGWRASREPVPVMPEGEVRIINRPGGSQLRVETIGPANKRTLVLTHGWSMTRGEWAYLYDQLKNEFRFVVWDLPGLGRSTSPVNVDFSLERMANDLQAVIESVGPSKVILGGHSIGGMIQLTLCRLQPEYVAQRVSEMLLIHTTYMNPLRTMRWSGLMTALEKPLIIPMLYVQIALSPIFWVLNWMSYWNGSMHSSTRRNGYSSSADESLIDFTADFVPYASPAVLARGSLGMLAYDAREILPQLPVKTLVIGASDDPITLASASRTIAEASPKCELIVLQSTKHYGFMEHIKVIADKINNFCRPKAEVVPPQSNLQVASKD